MVLLLLFEYLFPRLEWLIRRFGGRLGIPVAFFADDIVVNRLTDVFSGWYEKERRTLTHAGLQRRHVLIHDIARNVVVLGGQFLGPVLSLFAEML